MGTKTESTVDGAQSPSDGGAPAKKAPEHKQKFPLEVAAGKAITSSRGVLGPHAEVRKSDFEESQIEHLIRKGYIVRK